MRQLPFNYHIRPGAILRWVRGLACLCWTQARGSAADEESEIFSGQVRCGVLFRFGVCAVFLMLLFGLLVRHIYAIQVTRHDYFVEQSLAVCRRSRVETAQRGRIMDLNGNLFACDVAARDVYAEPKRFSAKIDQAVPVIARALGVDPGELRLRFENAARHDFAVTLGDTVGMDFIGRHRLAQIKGIELKPLFNSAGHPDVFKVAFHPSRVDSATRRRCIEQLAEIFGEDEDELTVACENARHRCQEIAVKLNVSREAADIMLAELKRLEINAGVRVVDAWVRTYPRDNAFANMLGFLDIDRNGVSGIEALMDSYLKPTTGKFTYKHDRRGRPVEEGTQYIVTPENGADVYLTIQEPLQQIVEEELAKLWEEFAPDRAYAIMLEPSTGAVMALAQYPQFNPNDRKTFADSDRIQNHCLIQAYDPGSVMKAVSLTGVLANNVAGLDTEVDCEHGIWYYGGRPLRDSHPMDILTLAEVVQKSSNVGTAKFSLQLGEEAMFKYLDGYQLGRKTGLGFYPAGKSPVCFKSEAQGKFRSLRSWDKLTITRMPIGQGIGLTPLQIVQTWSVLANNGVMMQPYIVDHVRYADGSVEYSQPKVKATPASAEAVRQMTEALVMVTQKGGTGTRAVVKGYNVAGKTGTAQMCLPTVVGKNKEGKDIVRYLYSSTQYFASFVGFAPAERPRFVLLVSAENPTKKYHTGSGVSAPTFGKIVARTLEYLQVPESSEELPPSSSVTMH